MSSAGDAVARLVREEYGRVLATLIRVTGSVVLAEDAAQDAMVRALETWPRDGLSDNPRAWLLVAAKRQAIDHIRREGRRADKEAAAMEHPVDDEPAEVVRDDLLRLVFTCCHPFLSLDAQVALALRTLGGLSTAEVARGLLVPEATMAKRLTRAKQKIAAAGIPYRVPAAEELPDRLDGVATTVYLIFNEGYADIGRAGVAAEALFAGPGAGRADARRADCAGPAVPEKKKKSPAALFFLVDGQPVLLADQDRTRWDGRAIKEGVELVGVALRRGPDNRYAVQAAIAACHALAPSYAETNWEAVVSWYDVLLTVHDTPVVRLNRAAAVAERDGPAAGLALVDGIADLESYPWWHASRAELLNRLGDKDAARAAFEKAVAAGINAPTAEHLRRRISG
ncbi:RNA polymerase sigma factor [Kutzneria sp. 744]|uniref:RNA polymerase sigma factor n=1 Tax=Kutzneria sp. (strain 744) TaxID=345341 RepID=UPI0004B4FA49|nr:sigma-70 family RNA polymerase sigma factor [Kutzneria sp. 744]